eukprot:CAMPEP_0195527880 /NCGR_PEP_ID=MMETSP0794_2-20130614/29787_1 /TAXON_ID=515487 /ORGANISM="Stephanopyxis turris, Strain CCMP 815" /LENGTH=306 /DNA_ID=CAMNT_0040658889 /DNA_START=259 /DNA_END=1175 /DNA_ORIENTATION=-
MNEIEGALVSRLQALYRGNEVRKKIVLQSRVDFDRVCRSILERALELPSSSGDTSGFLSIAEEECTPYWKRVDFCKGKTILSLPKFEKAAVTKGKPIATQDVKTPRSTNHQNKSCVSKVKKKISDFKQNDNHSSCAMSATKYNLNAPGKDDSQIIPLGTGKKIKPEAATVVWHDEKGGREEMVGLDTMQPNSPSPSQDIAEISCLASAKKIDRSRDQYFSAKATKKQDINKYNVASTKDYASSQDHKENMEAEDKGNAKAVAINRYKEDPDDTCSFSIQVKRLVRRCTLQELEDELVWAEHALKSR